MPRPSPRLALPAAMLIAFALVSAVAVRSADAPEARAAYAEYLEACDARDRSQALARQGAEQAAALVGGPDEMAAGAGAASGAYVAREAVAHADRLRAEWKDRWKRLGLDAK